MLQDLRLAARTLRRAPTFAAVVIATFALGIALNTVGFAVVRSVLLRPLAYPNASRVAAIWESNLERGWLRFGVSLQNFEDWRAESRAFDQLAAWWTGSGNLELGEQPQRVGYGLVSPNLFSVLGAQATIGRTLRAEENEPGSDGVAVVSYELWHRALAGRRDVVGQTVSLDGRLLEIVGVMPRGFRFPDATIDLWKPFGVRPDDAGSRGAHWAAAVGRLAPGASIRSAQAEMDAIAARLAQAYPANAGWTVLVEPLRETLVSDSRALLLVLWGAAGLILLIVCANVANLLLARGAGRDRELAIRTALGADRGRLVRLLVTESVVLAAIGGAVGVGAARVLVPLFADWAPSSVPRLEDLRLDGVVVAYAALLALAGGIVFGALPALRLAGGQIGGLLRAGARGGADRRGSRLRAGLVVAEIALAAMVLVAAGVTVRSVARLLSVDPGFAVAERLAFRVAPTMAAYDTRERAVAFYHRLTARLAAVPGVRSVAAINVAPPAGNWWSTKLLPEGREFAPDAEPVANFRVVTGDYFATLEIPIVRGRGFQGSDGGEGARVVVIDETAARRYWPDRDPLGTRVRFSPDPRAAWFTIVGVVGGVRHNALATDPSPIVYATLPQAEFGHFRDWAMTLILETDGEPLAFGRAVLAAVSEVAPTLPVFSVQSLEQRLATNVAERRAAMLLFSVFGGIAVLLAALGVYGVLAVSAAARTREIGVRVALGAPRRSIAGLVLREGLGLVGTGILVGLAAAAATTRAASSLLYEISPTDPVTYLAIAVLLVIVAIVASLVPVQRALRVDPVVALGAD
jgi:predicted permease